LFPGYQKGVVLLVFPVEAAMHLANDWLFPVDHHFAEAFGLALAPWAIGLPDPNVYGPAAVNDNPGLTRVECVFDEIVMVCRHDQPKCIDSARRVTQSPWFHLDIECVAHDAYELQGIVDLD
jgi:hypothetical protein